jgi:hypothetical protein
MYLNLRFSTVRMVLQARMIRRLQFLSMTLL